MAPFTTLFSGSLLINVVTTFRSSSYFPKYKHVFGFSRDSRTSSPNESTIETKSNPNDDAKHGNIMKKYLAVYLLAVLSDWLQGPYVYALYDAYGFSQHDIAILFVAGFGSSMIFGTFIGGLADSCGRKKFTIIFAVIYALSCVTKHFNDFGILMVGRLLGGIATSLLFSVFDSWLIRSHSEAGVTSYLSKSFAAAQYGNSIIAILAGLLANKVATLGEMKPFHSSDTGGSLLYKGGFLLPFDFALCALCICGALTFFLWEENYGDSNDSQEDANDEAKPKHWYDAFTTAYMTTIRSKEILYAGLICSLFEGSMFIFVFMWTPAMKALSSGELPFGLIFATFMVCCMAGSSIFSIVIPSIKVEKLGIYILSSATVSFILMATAPTDTTIMIAFLMFETCVGTYFPMMGTMKSVIVPESKRAAIYNLYRIPLNMIVLFSLLTDFTPKQSFILCIGMLITATFLMTRLVSHQQTYISTSPTEPSDLEHGEEEKLISTSGESDTDQKNSEKEG
jgi:MFS family permease